MRKIKITFERGGEVLASLNESQAPQTCERIWNLLPLGSVVTHSRWSGREINFSYHDTQCIPRENQTIYTSIGEICYWRDWDWEGFGDPPQVLAIYYGAELARSMKGNEPVNVFAQVDYSEIQKLIEIGEKVWLSGTEKIYVDRFEE
ncbi:DUF3830 family protein [Neobacillus sp. M.A.Huq-85]|nr:DUF3830 family protein [Neobacillus cucumis]